MEVCALLNERTVTLDLKAFLEIMISICYRLLRYRSLNDVERPCDSDAAYHMGLIIFMMTTFLHHKHHQIMDYKLVTLCFKDVVDGQSEELDNELLLWLLIVGGMWIAGDSHSEWLSHKIRTTTQRLGVDSRDEARKCMARFPWIDALHDEWSQRLWDELHFGSQKLF